jgi:uncharacterized membrane protein YbjE (DUF340 family)
MSPSLTILTILGAVGLGLLLSRVPALRRLSSTHTFNAVRTCVLAAMVAAMGFRTGRTEEVIRSAGTLGLASLAFAAATMAGTLIVLSFIFGLRKARGNEKRPPGKASAGSGRLLFGEPLLLLGMLAGGLLDGLALQMRPGAAMSLASGFGWYSLSGVILTRLDSPGLGAVSFLSNMLRESMALVLIPVLARTRFPLLAVGAGGATSMDVCLSITYRSLGGESIPLCMASGGILSFLVPLLVPLLYSL